jgi:RNA polymerase sigma factor (sigma-70 family)
MLMLAQAYLESKRHHVDPEAAAVAAWDHFFQTYSPLIGIQVRKRLRRGSSRDDCVQEIWRIFLIRFPRFEYDPERGRFHAWLITVVSRLASDFAWSAARDATSPLEAVEDSQLIDSHPGPVADCERGQLLNDFWATMDELRVEVSAENYQVFEGRLFDHCSVRELSVQLNISPNQVRVCDFRMGLRFRELLVRRLGEDYFRQT